MLVGSFNLSQSFNYAPYLFCKKQFKSEINCFCCIRTMKIVNIFVDVEIKTLCSLLLAYYVEDFVAV